jgi:hypothetical protein
MQSLISESAAATTSTKKRARCWARYEGPSERRSGRGAFEALSALGVYGGQVSSSLKREAWNAEDEDLDGLGIGKWDLANVVALTKRVGAPLWQGAVHQPPPVTRRAATTTRLAARRNRKSK